MNQRAFRRNQKGYTLIEVLAAVAILLIVCAIAIPAAGSLQKNLTLTKYDDVARQIYLVAQNRLTAMKATGALSRFLEDVEGHYSAQKLGNIDRQPQDYIVDTEDWKKLYYLADTDTVLENYIMGTDSLLLAAAEGGACYIMEVNPETGDVYGVFYAEKSFTYDDVAALLSRNKSDRRDQMLGYYGGIAELSAISNLPEHFEPTITVVNKEDLYLQIECTGMRRFVKTQDKIALTVLVTDESFVPENTTAHQYTVELKGGRDFWVRNDRVQVEVLLDSIRGGAESFAGITKGKLTAGDDITVTASMTYTDEGTTITGAATAAAINSLFAGKTDETNISVAYVRHLNNLRSSIYPYNGAGGVEISQTAAIDYDYTHWDNTAMISGKAGRNPYTGDFAPIENNKLFNRVTYNGNNNPILHFRISGSGNAGLFYSMQDSVLENIRLVDIAVTGSRYVGALAGAVRGGVIRDCSAYLETKDAYNRPLTNMAERVAEYTVSGTSYVGGLVGNVTGGTATENCFAAINTSGNTYVGGLFGDYSGGSIARSYASGKVQASGSYAGGIAARTSATAVDNCYTTADVTAQGYAGGFIGSVSGGSVRNSSSYGLVKRNTGLLDTATSGGFTGSRTGTFYNCRYLRQANYNYEYSTSLPGVAARGFPDMKVTDNLQSNCHPYSDALVGNILPFPMLTTSAGGIIPHYGDWPAELQLQSSLVYYEKYAKADADGSYYGYYAETSLMAEGDETETGTVNSWKVDTLRDEICIEDGYALMTIYPLTGFAYQLNNDLNPHTPAVMITTGDTAGTNTAVKISERVSLLFTNTMDGSRYTISNARVYQLPFSLQMTDRNTAARFYDRVTITGYVNEQVRFEDYTFFYCPDFAKNAVNPDISKTAADTPKNPTGEERPIYVRSPRHINALARAAYYWNTTKWTDSGDIRYHFVQETDIDFAKYTKTYCGMRYDLMDTTSANPYRNRPIGRPNSQAFTDPNGETYTPSNFRNSYDGQGRQIIDYCCVTTSADSYQFTGLFGEVQQAVLKNIVMVASDPENQSGYVISEYNDGAKHAGVGALAGLIYVNEGNEYNKSGYSTVSNCAVSGYVVRHAPAAASRQPSAAGGLVGYNFGKIENSSAVCKLVTIENSNAKAKYIGGLAGSVNGRGSITNCYAGGTLAAADTAAGNIYLAGICGGFDDIFGAYHTASGMANRNMSIQNVYSYCTWDNAAYKNSYAVTNVIDKIVTSNAYYLTETVMNGVALKTPDGAVACSFSQLSEVGFKAVNTAHASGLAAAEDTYPWTERLKDAAYSFPAVVINPRSAATSYVHYGDWYYEMLTRSTGFLTYYERYTDGSYAQSFLNTDGRRQEIGSLDANNSKTIAEAGYGVLRLQNDGGVLEINGKTLETGELLQSGIAVNKGIYSLYSLSPETSAQLLPQAGEKAAKIEFAYDITTDFTRTPAKDTIYVNANYANAISSELLSASAENPLLVRTVQQLQNMSTAAAGWYLKLDHDITATAEAGGIINSGYTFQGGYVQGGYRKTYNGFQTGTNGNHIFGLTRPLFESIAKGGAVENLALVGVGMNNGAAAQAPLAVTNNGSIRNCFASGTITNTSSQRGSAGLVITNTGSITTSYSSCTITNVRADAAGLVMRNSGSIQNCYAAGNVTAGAGSASGFIGTCDTGSSVSYCYTTAIVQGAQVYGFAPYGAAGVRNTCYWTKDPLINPAITNSAGTVRTSGQMAMVFNSGVWSVFNKDASWGTTLTGSYPYPRIAALDHCGDWNRITDGRVGGLQIYRQNNGRYYANGNVVELGSFPNTAEYTYRGNSYVVNYTYGIFFDSKFAENLSQWEAVLIYQYFSYGSWHTAEKKIELSARRDYTLYNAGDFYVNTTRLSYNQFPISIELRNQNGVTLKFIYLEDENKFSFIF